MVTLSKKQSVQEEEYNFPYHYLNLLSPFQDIEYVSYLKIVKKLLLLKGERILDFGCGDGRFEYELKNENCKLAGLDYSNKAIAFARAFNFGSKNTTFYPLKLKYFKPKKKFDYVVSIETLEHIPTSELSEVIAILKNLLRKGGRLIITVPSKNVPLSDKHYQHFNEKDVRSLFSDDFTVEKIIGHHKKSSVYVLFRILNVMGRIFETVLPQNLSSVYGRFLWKFYKSEFEFCSPSKARRLIVVSRKIR